MLFFDKKPITILRPASLADVRKLEERPPNTHDLDAVRKMTIVVVSIVDEATCQSQETIVPWASIQADDRAELLTTLRKIGIQDRTMARLGEALPALAAVFPTVAVELKLLHQALESTGQGLLELPSSTLVAAYTILCEEQTSPLTPTEQRKRGVSMKIEPDRLSDRKRSLYAIVMHLTDLGYGQGDPNVAVRVWSQAVGRAGALYGGLATHAPSPERDPAATMSAFLTDMARDLSVLVAAVERARHAPKPKIEIAPEHRLRERNLQISLFG